MAGPSDFALDYRLGVRLAATSIAAAKQAQVIMG